MECTSIEDCDHNEERTPLIEAAIRNHFEMTELLFVGHRADVEHTDRHGKTALDYAEEQGHAQVAALLQWHRDDDEGRTSLQLAATKNNVEITRLLLEADLAIDHCRHPRYPDNCWGNEERTPLIEAAMRNHIEMTELLLEAGADVESKDRRGNTALDYAEERGHAEVAALLRRRVRRRVAQP